MVVEGCGANGCEYMTGGTAVILGKVGEEFRCGHDRRDGLHARRDRRVRRRANPDSIVWQRFGSSYWETKCKAMVAEHAVATDSKWAHTVLDDWDRWRGHFWQVCPKEMLERLPRPLNDTAPAEEIAAAE